MLRDKRILLGVTGGIAAYKSVQLLRDLQEAGADVRVIMTPNATRFIGFETFQSLTGGYTAAHIFQEHSVDSSAWIKHVHWAEWADLFLISPCTANTLSKVAHGASDNLLTTTILAARCPVLLCPTMDGHMYDAPATQENLQKVKDYGYHVLEPDYGYLASGLEGKGRLPDRTSILNKIEDLLSRRKEENNQSPSPLLQGKKVVVTAGPTREPIDPVRFISNPSSGKMGVAMAEAAQQLGGNVTLIHGPMTTTVSHNEIKTVPITTAEELHQAVRNQDGVDVFILAAAVSDFAPENTYTQKVKKDQAEKSIQLKTTPDTLLWLGEHKKDGQTVIGFAMESENVNENAAKKREKKKADWIVANSISEKNSGFAGDNNKVTIIGPDTEKSFQGSKKVIALKILETVFSSTT